MTAPLPLTNAAPPPDRVRDCGCRDKRSRFAPVPAPVHDAPTRSETPADVPVAPTEGA